MDGTYKALFKAPKALYALNHYSFKPHLHWLTGNAAEKTNDHWQTPGCQPSYLSKQNDSQGEMADAGAFKIQTDNQHKTKVRNVGYPG